MKAPKFKKKKTYLEQEIEDIEILLRDTSPESKDEYDRLTSILGSLYALRDKEKNSKKSIDPNTLAVIVGGLLELGLIMNYERFNVITTKGFSRIIRPRV